MASPTARRRRFIVTTNRHGCSATVGVACGCASGPAQSSPSRRYLQPRPALYRARSPGLPRQPSDRRWWTLALALAGGRRSPPRLVVVAIADPALSTIVVRPVQQPLIPGSTLPCGSVRWSAGVRLAWPARSSSGCVPTRAPNGDDIVVLLPGSVAGRRSCGGAGRARPIHWAAAAVQQADRILHRRYRDCSRKLPPDQSRRSEPRCGGRDAVWPDACGIRADRNALG